LLTFNAKVNSNFISYPKGPILTRGLRYLLDYISYFPCDEGLANYIKMRGPCASDIAY